MRDLRDLTTVIEADLERGAPSEELLEQVLGLTRVLVHRSPRRPRANALRQVVTDSDVVQNVMEKFLRNFHALRNPTPAGLIAFVKKVTENAILDVYRGAQRDDRVLTEGPQNLPENVDSPGESPSASIEREESALQIALEIERLPAEQREVVVRRIYGEESYKQIHSDTGIPIATLHSRMNAALKKLAESLADNARSGN